MPLTSRLEPRPDAVIPTLISWLPLRFTIHYDLKCNGYVLIGAIVGVHAVAGYRAVQAASDSHLLKPLMSFSKRNPGPRHCPGFPDAQPNNPINLSAMTTRFGAVH